MDYCSGYIKVMDPLTYEVHTTLATGIDRPVAMAVDQEGALYYLARAGMGGGSPQDNTSSDNGRLMKIIFTGSGAPFISRQPQAQLIAENESASFSVTTFGEAPITFQWKKDGVNIPDANEPTYTFENAVLTDDQTIFTCLIQNSFGEILSEEALLTVVDGNRPDPQITFPEEGTTYSAGTSINFSGVATDAEDGNLDATSFVWKVDFHHLDHTHPAMSSLESVNEGIFDIPSVGEISEEVFYRIYLTVTDQDGLNQTTYRDVFPKKTSFALSTEPANLQLIVDGKEENTPGDISSVQGIQRSIYAPASQIRNDSIFTFDRWENGSEDPLVTFFAGEENVHKAIYTGHRINGGVGLFGEYFDYLNDEPSFDQEPAFSKINWEIDYNWVLGSPNQWVIGKDSFSVRWTGSIVPLFDEEYTFYLDADDGVRLWIDEQLIIDEWEIRSFGEEVSGKITLEAGKFYAFRLEYFEDRSNAKVILSWESEHTPKQVVPRDNLFPKVCENTNNYTVNLYPNPARDLLNLRITSQETFEAEFEIIDVSGRLIDQKTYRVSKLFQETDFDIRNLSPGLYFLHINDDTEEGRVIPFKKD